MSAAGAGGAQPWERSPGRWALPRCCRRRSTNCRCCWPPPTLPLRSYNFAKEEAAFAYEHTRGSLKLGAAYSLKARAALLAGPGGG